jgi:DNA-3-methyladenine glycosylase
MYGEPGTAYVYICYGLHQMMNIVTNVSGIPDAVLIRAAEPLGGIDVMCARTGKKWPDASITRGPGNVAKALGIVKQHSGYSLRGDRIQLMEDGFSVDAAQIGTSERIGVEGAGPDAGLPYRFYLRGNRYVSGRKV